MTRLEGSVFWEDRFERLWRARLKNLKNRSHEQRLARVRYPWMPHWAIRALVWCLCAKTPWERRALREQTRRFVEVEREDGRFYDDLAAG